MWYAGNDDANDESHPNWYADTDCANDESQPKCNAGID